MASIIVNNYNYGRFLKDAIDSALSQTHPQTEVIVVDDGSTDESRKIIAEYGSRIIPILKTNGGNASAFNAGFAASRGEVVLFLDADDVLLPQAVEKALPCFDDPDVVKAHWPLWRVDRQGRKTGQVIPDYALAEGNLRDTVIRDGPDSCPSPPTSGNAWLRGFLEKVFPVPLMGGGVDCCDAYLTTLASIFGAIKKISEPQGSYRIHGGNGSMSTTAGEKNRRNLRSYDYRCLALSTYLRNMGIIINPKVWKEGNPHYTWMLWRDMALEEIKELIPQGETFILVDEDQLFEGTEVVAGRRDVPFLERDGDYYGPPLDDKTAIGEFERLRRLGASFIVFAWPAFWWLDYYAGLRNYLRSKFRCVLENERIVVFDLRA